jgi:hypothetical protein
MNDEETKQERKRKTTKEGKKEPENARQVSK